MKVVIINKSDTTGGAAVVSRRLTEALRNEGVDARMLVAEKLSDSPFVELAAPKWKIKWCFLWERIKIFCANGFNRSTLFKIDTGEIGLPLWRHPLVKNADAILLNWVNQGMLSLNGVGRILKLGKTVVWTMHDMWEMTGICHHAGTCLNFQNQCGNCPLLSDKASPYDISFKTHSLKQKVYNSGANKIIFVAVSNWLKNKSTESTLLNNQKVVVIPNAFRSIETPNDIKGQDNPKGKQQLAGKIRILFVAARIDDPIKGLDALRIASEILAREYPVIAGRLEIAFLGNIKNPKEIDGFGLPVINLGSVKGDENIARIYRDSEIVVSASHYETLPGTMVEAQAYGAIPVAFNQGGQADIINHLHTGYLADYNSDINIRARNLAEGIKWAVSIIESPEQYREMKNKMEQNVKERFSYETIASKYISLIEIQQG
ncbi:MAG: glycosyltransferase [Muribaculaceae bacterium]|nr:glycosyltransferase [Muribaculaceae bacterium]